MSVDWSEAPEGATHWDGAELGFMRPSLTVGDWDYFAVGDKWTFYGRINNQIRSDMVARPVTWDGEGLPPIGTVCETNVEGAWEESTVIAHDYGMAIIRRFSNEHEATMYDPVGESQIRPIRTEEQTAADERLHNIRNALSAIHAGTNFPGDTVRANILLAAVEAMIDAGYRKQPTP